MAQQKPGTVKYSRGGTTPLRRVEGAICPMHALMLTAWRVGR